MGESHKIEEDFVHLARLSANEQWDDVRLFISRLIRRYRNTHPEMAEHFNEFLKSNPTRKNPTFRAHPQSAADSALDLSMFRDFEQDTIDAPLLPDETAAVIDQIILERQKISDLKKAGLSPSRSAILIGPPGVGKTMTARWIAAQIDQPFLVLDLASIMSSYLGETGNNLKKTIAHAKDVNAVLLLDEIDAIAKKRSDVSDIGELKRLVTVVLQELDDWPDTSLLLAATNHAEMIDPALWRRFDLVIKLDVLDTSQIFSAVNRFLAKDKKYFTKWVDSLALCMEGESTGSIEKIIQRFRRSLALGLSKPEDLVIDYITSRIQELDHKNQIELATNMAINTNLSQHKISDITGVARDTIRKYAAMDKAG